MEFSTKREKLKKYLTLVEDMSGRFRYFQIQQIPRVENQKVDKLAQAASGQKDSPLPE